MPRSRLIALIWAIGICILLGAWAHSIVRKSFIRYDKPRDRIRYTIGLQSGSVEYTRVPIWGNGKNKLQAFSLKYAPGPPAPPVDYKFGRFYKKITPVKFRDIDDQIGIYEFPIWVLALLWSLLWFPFYRRARRKRRAHQQQLEADSAPPAPS